MPPKLYEIKKFHGQHLFKSFFLPLRMTLISTFSHKQGPSNHRVKNLFQKMQHFSTQTEWQEGRTGEFYCTVECSLSVWTRQWLWLSVVFAMSNDRTRFVRVLVVVNCQKNVWICVPRDYFYFLFHQKYDKAIFSLRSDC